MENNINDKPIITIVGRANVGKSTLFNRLVGKRVAIVEDLPGTTRDRVFGDTLWEGREITLIDTGGLELKPGSSIGLKVKEQVKAAIEEADATIFLTDVRDGLSASDWEVADMLRGSTKPVVLATNKADNFKLESQVAEFNQLGVGTPVAVSVHHGRGITELMDRTISLLPPQSAATDSSEMMRVAIIGRPNVGKSMLLNALLHEERAIVDETPGTTRDALDTVYHYDNKSVLFIDTAGIRRRGQVQSGIEYYSVVRALRAVGRADVVILVIDAVEGITAQDLHIAGYVRDAFTGMMLAVNKWDLMPEEEKRRYTSGIRHRLRFMPYVSVLYTSAKFGYGVDRILPQAEVICQERQKHLSLFQLNSFVPEVVASHNLPRVGTRQLKLISLTQQGINPPTFIFSVNDPKLVHFSYHRYLENKLRKYFGFAGTPLRLIFKRATNKRSSKANSIHLPGWSQYQEVEVKT